MAFLLFVFFLIFSLFLFLCLEEEMFQQKYLCSVKMTKE